MFARHITLQLKPPLAKESPVAFEKEIVPLLKQRKGFVDELLLITSEKKEVVRRATELIHLFFIQKG